MAAISTPHSSRGLSSSHRSPELSSDQWDFSIPADPEPNIINVKPTSAGSQIQYQRYDFTSSDLDEIHAQPTHPAQLDEIEHAALNGNSTPKSRKGGHNVDPTYLSPYKQGSRPGLSDSRSGSEPDSLIDLYGHPGSVASKSIGGNSDRTDRMDHQPIDHARMEDDEDPDRSRWIHRDKLALIESKEMQEAGIIPPPQQLRTSSSSKGRREPSQDKYTNGNQEHELEVRSAKEGKKRRIRSPVRHEEEEGTTFQDFDLRTPEEIAADSSLERSTGSMYRQQGLRSSSSRIPLPRSSPVPIPQGHIERNTPLPRKRGVSSGEEDGIPNSNTRSRNNSVGSQILLDGPDLTKSPVDYHVSSSRPTSQGSPTKARAPTNRAAYTRKPSISTPNATNQKPRTTSTATRSPSTPIRPRSRSGLEPRPPTAINRPEGDPPWLATMFKPDPRLPPDQQLLPTHAKKLQQEQWEKAKKESESRQAVRAKNGHATDGTTLERDDAKGFSSPQAAHTRDALQPPTNINTSRQEEQHTRDSEHDPRRDSGSEWPLPKAAAKPAPSPGRISPGSDSGRIASYSTMPRVRSGQQDVAGAPTGGVTGASARGKEKPMDPFEKERIARMEADEEEAEGRKKKKQKETGCACCVVM